MSPLKSSMLAIGERVPALRLNDVDGATGSLSDAVSAGPVLLLFAPGSWSPHTRGMVADLYRHVDSFKKIGVTIVLVVTESVRTARRLLPDDGAMFPILVDDDRQVARDFGVYRAFSRDGIGVTRPAAFLVERDGVLRFIYVGDRDADVPAVADLLRLAGWIFEARVDAEPLEAMGYPADVLPDRRPPDHELQVTTVVPPLTEPAPESDGAAGLALGDTVGLGTEVLAVTDVAATEGPLAEVVAAGNDDPPIGVAVIAEAPLGVAGAELEADSGPPTAPASR